MKPNLAKIMLLVAVILMDILGGVELDLIVPSFPELQERFGLSPFLVEALLSVNFIGFGISLFFVGSFADIYGRKPIILLGLGTFIFGSCLCLWATSYPIILVGRFIQGVGIAAPASLCFLIIADSYKMKEQQFFMAMLNGLVNISVGIAPVIGSYITKYFHWHGNIVALLSMGGMVMVMTLVFVPNTKTNTNNKKLSLVGYMPIFKSAPLMLLIFNFVFMVSTYFIFVGMSPILYMEDLGLSLSEFGWYQGSFAMIFALGSLFFGSILHKYDQKKMVILSIYTFIFSIVLVAVAAYTDTRNPLIITLAFIPYNLSAVIPSAIIYPMCLNFMPEAKGKVSAVSRAMLLCASALGLEIAGHYYVGSFRNIGIIMLISMIVCVITMIYIIRDKRIVI